MAGARGSEGGGAEPARPGPEARRARDRLQFGRGFDCRVRPARVDGDHRVSLAGESRLMSPAKPSRRVLVVEDEWLIAEVLKETLEDAGYQVIGPVSRVAPALRLIEEHDLDAAVLDVSLATEASFPIAHSLAAGSIPFIFVTGYVNADLPVDFKGRPILNKPIEETALISLLERLLGQGLAPS